MVSIVMPIRNAENYLKECLNSILNQNFDDWELIAVNDHSSDNTEAILKKYIAEDNRIQYFNNVGKGIIDALQLAYSKSKGDYITRMDADDIMPSEKLELMHKAIVENPNNLVTGKVIYIAENELFDGYIRYEKWLNSLVDNKNHYQEIYKECVIASPCWMISRAQFENCGAFNSDIYPEDYDLVFRFYENKIPIVALSEILHVWRDHSTRASRNDDNYADNSFLNIKTNYFIKVDHNKSKKTVLWGAGKKAKRTAKILQENNIEFEWVCNNENKIGHTIYNILLQNVAGYFKMDSNYQAIIQVANLEAQTQIRKKLENNKNVEAFWFC